MLISLLLGTLVGAVLGLTGAGGGILAVPALVVGLGWSMQEAAPVALIAVAGSAAVGAVEAFRKGLVRYRAAALMALSGFPFTWLGISLAHATSQRALAALFAALMLLVAIRLLRQALAAGAVGVASGKPLARIDPATGRLRWNRPTALLLAGIGGLTGLATGLLGVGGGFVIVPLLRRFTDVPMHGIVATSLLVIALVGSGGVLAAVWRGASLPAGPTALFTVATAIGMLAGRGLSQRLSSRQVQIGFATILLIVAIGMLGKAATNV
ncbi:MAG: sulfite exporter TauE/SafE family protein [Caldimonas sp.]